MMRNRLRPPDLVLLGVVFPLWVVCFLFHLMNTVQGELARVPILVSPSVTPDAYPVIRAFRHGTQEINSQLAIGDAILSIGEESLQGSGPFGFIARVYVAASG